MISRKIYWTSFTVILYIERAALHLTSESDTKELEYCKTVAPILQTRRVNK